MKKMKAIIICAFLLLILVTITCTVVFAVKSYQYDMDPANGIDIMEGMGAAFLILIGGLVVFYEIDLFYTVYYFFIRPKTLVKSIIVILSDLTLLLVLFSGNIIDFVRIYFPNIAESPFEEGIIPIGLVSIYFVLKIVSLMIGFNAEEE
jgi:hypothetical protein